MWVVSCFTCSLTWAAVAERGEGGSKTCHVVWHLRGSAPHQMGSAWKIAPLPCNRV